MNGSLGPGEERLAAHRRSLQCALPDLSLQSLRLDAGGQNNDVVIVNGSLVARFPLYPDGVARLRTEVDVLGALASLLPLPIPQPSLQAVPPRASRDVFAVYALLPGSPLTQLAKDTLHGDVLRRVGCRLARFLTALHAVPLSTLPGVVVQSDALAPWSAMYDRIQTVLFPAMSTEARRWTSHHFESFLGNRGHRDNPTVLIHGDFGASNILFDERSGEVSGVIDWSSAGAGDPAIDLAAAATIAPGLLDVMADHYPDMPSMLPRIAFYGGTFALQEALFGAENGDRAALQAGLADIPPRDSLPDAYSHHLRQ